MVSSVTSTHKSYQPFESFWTSCSICFLHRPGTLQEGDQKFLIVIFGKVTNSRPCTITKMDISRPTFFFHSYSLINSVISLPGPSSEAFFSRLQNRGVRIWQGVEIFPQHAVFIAHHAVFYCTADARLDSDILQKFLKKWLFWTYLIPIISKAIQLYLQ